MTGCEKIEAALSPDGTREIPVVICYDEIFVRDHWAQITGAPWWHMWTQDVEQQTGWRIDYLRKVRPDWISIYGIAAREDREALRVEERPDGVWQVDRRTGAEKRFVHYEPGGWHPDHRAHSFHPAHPPETPEEIDALFPPRKPFDAKDYVSRGRADLPREVLRRTKGEVYPCGGVNSPLWCGYDVWGFEGWMLQVAEDSELLRYANARFLDYALYDAREAAACGARGVWLQECMTDMLSPDAFRRLNLPMLRRLTDETRSLGMKSIYYYCGNPAGKWDMLFDSGADALALEEGKKGWTVDIDDVVDRAAGRCAVLGNLDAINLLPRASESDLRAEIARQIAAGRRNGSRFIMSIGSPVTPGTSVERVRLYCDLARELGAE
jgi:hypothetical protein